MLVGYFLIGCGDTGKVSENKTAEHIPYGGTKILLYKPLFSLDDSLYYFEKIMPYKPNMKACKGIGKKGA